MPLESGGPPVRVARRRGKTPCRGRLGSCWVSNLSGARLGCTTEGEERSVSSATMQTA
jgi:hypothetical protein